MQSEVYSLGKIKAKSLILNVLSYAFLKTEFAKWRVCRAIENLKIESHSFSELYFYPFRRIIVEYAKHFERYKCLNSVMALPDIYSKDG